MTLVATIYLIAGILLLALAIGLFIYNMRGLSRCIAVNSWPTAEGEILTAYIEKETDSDGGYSERFELSYQYTVQGQIYIHDRIKAGEYIQLTFGKMYSTAQKFRRKYFPRKKVQVYYNPVNYQDACLETGGILTLVFVYFPASLAFLLGAFHFFSKIQ